MLELLENWLHWRDHRRTGRSRLEICAVRDVPHKFQVDSSPTAAWRGRASPLDRVTPRPAGHLRQNETHGLQSCLCNSAYTETTCAWSWPLLFWMPIFYCWPVLGKTCATTQKNVKSHVFFDFEKNVKKRKKTYIWFHRPHNHPAFNTQLPKVSTSKSPTSNILLRNADTRNYAT